MVFAPRLHHFLTAGSVGDEFGAAGVQGDTRRQGSVAKERSHLQLEQDCGQYSNLGDPVCIKAKW